MPRNKPKREIVTKFQVWWPDKGGGFCAGSGEMETLEGARACAIKGDRIMRLETIFTVEEEL